MTRCQHSHSVSCDTRESGLTSELRRRPKATPSFTVRGFGNILVQSNLHTDQICFDYGNERYVWFTFPNTGHRS